ncbi:glycosyltransferase family 2 protein [Vibrio mimicus]
MITWALTLLFSVASGLIIYHHFGYPVLLRWYAGRHPLPESKVPSRGYQASQTDLHYPSITILVPAYNEQRWIAEKIRNLSALDYPRDKLRIVIACDGCQDKTAEIAQETIQEAICADTLFEIHIYPQNRGKVAVINQLMNMVDSDITALSDVSALISIDAMLIAAQHFTDAQVGVVNATYQGLPNASNEEKAYWQYQNQIKLHESSFGSTLGSHGALYLFRTSLFTPLPANTINDDFILPMRIVEQGYQARYDLNMLAIEMEPTGQPEDFRRRLRISAGNMQQAITLFRLFSPKHGKVAFAFLSGKGLRLLTPYLMLTCLISSALLAIHNPLFVVLLGGQISLYLIATCSHWMPEQRQPSLLRWLHYLVFGHIANFIGGLRYLCGYEKGRWIKVNH